MSEVVNELLRVGSANVSDALRALGLHFQAMDGGIRPLHPSMATAGPVFTVRCYPGATFAIEKALELARPGDVLVVDGGGYPDVILMGGLMSTRLKQRGVAGAILDAAVRDVDDIIALNFPVFSRHICPRAGTFAEIGECQTVICCGRTPVTPGDWVLADASGIVVIPANQLSATVEKAQAINHREGQIARHLREGKTLAQAAELSKPQ